MRTVRQPRLQVRALATVLLAVITAVALAGCGAEEPEKEGRTPRTPRSETTKPVETTTPATSADPSGSVSPTTPPPTTPPTTPPPEAPKPKKVKVTVKEGEIKGAPGRLEVKIGQTVQIDIRSDVADELHVHSIEQTFAVPADERVTFEFVVPPEPGPGLYVVELHALGQLVFGLEVR